MIAQPPSVVVFDVNETLSDMRPLTRRFSDLGLPELAAKIWFASLLRDGFALTATGGFEHFSSLGESALRTILFDSDFDGDTDTAVSHVMAGFAALDVHPDVPDGVRRLAATGIRLITLTNGAATVAEQLFTRAGIRDKFDELLSVDTAGVWKPAPGAYQHAAQSCRTPLDEMMLVAVHPWDIDGASRAGMSTAWINRTESPYPPYFSPPDVTVSRLTDLAGQIPSIKAR